MQAVFLRVVNLSVSASYVIAAVMLMRLALRRAPRWAVCALWALAAVRLCCPFSLESALSLLPSGAVVNEAALLENAGTGTPIIQSGFAIIDERANAALAGMSVPVDASAVPSVPQAAPGEQTQQSALTPVKSAAPIITAVQAGTWVWLTGMGLMLLYGAGSYLLLRRRLRTAVHWRDELWQSEAVEAPFVLGFFRPRVYLPFAMDSPAFPLIIAHERAHIRRHDQITKLLAWVLLSVYWFNPLCWVAYSLLGRDIELACDELVIRDLNANDRKRYARALLAWGMNRPTLDACPVAFGEVGLKERILKVTQYKKPALWAMALAVVLIAGSAVCLLTSPAAQADVGPTVSPTMQTVPPTAQPNETAAQTYVDPYEAPDAIPILTVRPRAVTADEAKAIVTAIFGDAPVYEDIPGAAEPVPCDWTFHPDSYYIGENEPEPRDDSVLAGQEYIRAYVETDGRRSSILVDNADTTSKAKGVGGPVYRLMISLEALPVSSPPPIPTQEEIDAMCAQVAGWLDQMGLENYAVADLDVRTGGFTVDITARPLYEGVPQLPPYWQEEDQTLWFSFAGGELQMCTYSTPLEVISSQPVERLMSLRDALAATELEDSLIELPWRFCYTRVSAGEGTEDSLLVPSYRYWPVNLPGSDNTDVMIVSAVDGTLLADMRTAAPTPTPQPAVQQIQVRWGVAGADDYAQLGALSMPAGETIPLCVIWSPSSIHAAPEWTVDDPDVVSLAPDESGIFCDCAMVGQPGQSTTLHVKVNEVQADIAVSVNG